MLPGFSGHMLMGADEGPPMTLELMTALTATNITSNTITIPAAAEVGDIALFTQYGQATSTPPAVEFPGATTIVNSVGGPSNVRRAMMSYKILEPGDPGKALAGMTSSTRIKTVRIIRPSKPISNIAIGSVNNQWGSSSFLHTITTPPGSPAFIFGRALNAQSALTPQGTLTSNGVQLNENANANYRTWVEVQNLDAVSRTLGVSGSTGVLLSQSCYGVVT